VNHRTAGFDFLDRLSASSGSVDAASLRDDLIRGAVVVNTCNRFEVYLDVHDGADAVAAERVARAVATGIESPVAEVRERIGTTIGDAALGHLFAVSSGLESVAVGEEEIAGQVTRAYESARAVGATSPDLDRAFQRAAKVSRQVRDETALGATGRSLVQLALDLAESRVQDWRRARVLVVGTGRYAATTITALRTRGVVDLAVYSATGRAEQFARRYGVRAIDDLGAGIGSAQLVITCTTRYAVSPGEVTGATPKLFVDLGVPRNVDPSVASMPGVEVLDLDLIARHSHVADLVPDGAARDLVQEAVDQYAAEQAATPAIVALRRHVFDLLDAEIGRATVRAEAGGASAEALDETISAMRHLVSVLMHTPSQRARQLAARGEHERFERGIVDLFGLDPTGDADLAPVSPIRTPTVADDRDRARNAR
jgi:glutamyl-tRNA reductase